MSIAEFGFGLLDPSALTTGLSIAAVSGVTGPSLTGLQIIKTNSNVHNNFVEILGTLSFTATAATAVLDITVPNATTDVFADAAQVQGVANVLTGTGLGNLTVLVTTAATRNIRATFALGSGAGVYTINFAFTFQINQALTP